MVSLPLANTGIDNAQEFLGLTNGACSYIYRWGGSSWQIYSAAGGTNFPVRVGEGYMLYCLNATSTMNFIGNQLPEQAPSIRLSTGPNYMGLPVQAGSMTAESLLQQIDTATGNTTCPYLYKMENGQYVVHSIGLSLNNFQLRNGEGYIAQCTNGGEVAISTS